MPAPALEELRSAPGEPTAAVAARVREARERQRRRFGSDRATCNASLRDADLEKAAPLESDARALLDRAYERLGLSARALSRIVKVARTIADLDGSDRLGTDHVAEAVQYRSLDRQHG